MTRKKLSVLEGSFKTYTRYFKKKFNLSKSFGQFLKFTLDFLTDLRNFYLSILDKEQKIIDTF